MSDVVFPDGIMYSKPNENTPDFVKGRISIRISDAIPFLQANANNGWVNLDLLLSKKGSMYLKLNDWKPQNSGHSQDNTPTPSDGIPF